MEENIPTSAGLSSYNLLNEKKLFHTLSLRPGIIMLDLGCGVGNYTVTASPYIGDKGFVCAMDLWEEGIETLMVRTNIGKLSNIHPIVADASYSLPFQRNSFDLCLMATFIHILHHEGTMKRVLRGVKHILKADGMLAVVEFHKIEGPPGPPLGWRLTPGQLGAQLSSLGYDCINTVDISPNNYLSIFRYSD